MYRVSLRGRKSDTMDTHDLSEGVGGVVWGRDPSTLEVLGSSSSDENKTMLTSNLYMTANKTKTGYVLSG